MKGIRCSKLICNLKTLGIKGLNEVQVLKQSGSRLGVEMLKLAGLKVVQVLKRSASGLGVEKYFLK